VSSKGPSKNTLLIQGAKSWPEAKLCIDHFEKTILDQCNEVLAQASEGLGAIKVGPWDVNGWLGIEAKLGVSRCMLYSGLYWNRDSTLGGPLFVMSDLGITGRGQRDIRKRVLTKLQNEHQEMPRTDFNPNECELTFCEEIDPNDVISFKERLARVVSKWAVALKAVGGVDRLLGE
jgi:hypothetical protein